MRAWKPILFTGVDLPIAHAPTYRPELRMTEGLAPHTGEHMSWDERKDREERFLRAILDSIFDVIVVCDAGGKLTHFNRAARELYGAPDGSLQAGEWADRYAMLAATGAAPLPTEEMPLVRALNRPDEMHVVKYIVAREGVRRHSLISHAQAIRGPRGDVIGAVSASRDVTEETRAAAAERESDARYRATRDAALDAFMVLDAVRDDAGQLVDFVYRDVNAEGVILMGKSRAELLGHGFRVLFPGAEQAEHFETYRRVLDTGIAEEHHFKSPFLRKETWIHRRILRLGDGVIVTARDVTVERRLEAERTNMLRLQEGERNFRTIAEAIPQIVWTARPDGHVDYYNQRWFDYTGMTAEQTIGWGWEPVIHPEDLPNCVQRWTHSFTTGEPYEVEYRFLRASDRAYRWFLGRALPVRDADGAVVKWFGTATDIHDQKLELTDLETRVALRTAELQAAKDAAERARESAEASNRAKSDFLSRMSHELRTPLNSIIGFTGVLQRNKRGALDETETAYLTRIRANGQHLLRLINDVLDLAKVEAGHVDLVWSRVDIDTLIVDVCSTLVGRITEGDVRMELRRDAVHPSATAPLLRADETKLRQVLLNVIGNAVKFTPPGGSVVVSVTRDVCSGYPLRVAVADTGIGIPPEAQARVFEAFEQAESGTTARFGGTGLGLPISRALCEAMGFRLALESEVGVGSTFTISFDRRLHPREPIPEVE